MGEKKELVKQRETVANIVLTKIQGLEKQGDIALAPNYSAENALKSAWLTLQSTKDMDKRPVLQVCTDKSVREALYNMVIQGLSPSKNQCYFIAYGDQLALSRSYFGTVAAAKNVNREMKGINSQVIYQGDEFVYEILPETGQKRIISHKQEFGNIDNSKIIGAYSIIMGVDGSIIHTEVMTYAQILTAWKQSRLKPVLDNGKLNPRSFHAKFTDQACLKTVIARACKMIINTSDDKGVMAGAFNRTTEQEYEEKVVSPEPGPEKKSTITSQLPVAEEPAPCEVEEAEEFCEEQDPAVEDSLFGGPLGT